MVSQYSSAAEDVAAVVTTAAPRATLQTLPIELLAEIFSELDLESLIVISSLSRMLRVITADESLNLWRRPILRNLRQGVYEKSLFHLSVRSTVPRKNWIEILTFASPDFLLFNSTLPNLKSSEWEESFRRRFLPGWAKWKKDFSWKETFMKTLYRVWHRGRSSCTSDESWTKYVVINRNGTLNELEASSRSFNPITIFDEMKVQSNIAHFPTKISVVLQLADVRIITLGVVNHPRTDLMVNRNARAFLCPPGLEPSGTNVNGDGRVNHSYAFNSISSVPMHVGNLYGRLFHPTPSDTHSNYPMYTPGGGDQRWHPNVIPEEGMQWVGGLMYAKWVELYFKTTSHGLQELQFFNGQFASFTWQDFVTIAPWMEKRITKCIHGQGLGID